ncbi:MAG: DUF4340 domain-containing protein [Deltaproteobacteria bacterium]|nr:MAG: DUF4340 domain-containing protein [Deltaproteobacteria bacterium]
MKQTTKTLVGLLVLLLLAGGIAGLALWAGKDEQKKAEAKEKSEKLFDFDKAHVKDLRLSKEGQLAMRLTKGEKAWKLVQPVEAEGDDSAVDSLLTSLSALKQKKDLAEEKDLKAYGLDQPKLEVRIQLDDGKEQGLQIGTDNTFDNTLFAKKLGDGTVRVIDGYQKNTFDKTAFDLRDKKVAHLDDSAEVRRIEVTGVKAPYTLEKDGTTWKVNGAPADGPAADRVAGALKSLRATAIASETAASLKEFGLDKPKATARLTVGAGKDTYTRAVLVGQAKGSATPQKTYAKRDESSVVYEVDKQIVSDLEKEPFDLQNKELVKLDREAVRKVVFESPSGRVEVTRVKNTPPDGGLPDEVFTVVAPQQGAAKKWKLSSALYSIASLRATAFEGAVPAQKEMAKYGLEKPKTVTVLGEGDKVLARVRLGAEKDNKRYALADGFDRLVRVEKSTVDDWPWTVNDALDAPPPPPQASKQEPSR